MLCVIQNINNHVWLIGKINKQSSICILVSFTILQFYESIIFYFLVIFSLVISYRTSNLNANLKNMETIIGITFSSFFTPSSLSFNLMSSLKME